MKKIILLTILAGLTLTVFGNGRSDMDRRLDRLMQKEMKSIKHGGISFSLARGEEILFSRGYGMADEQAGIPMEPGTPSSVASVTKLFTATAVVQLAEQGLLDLDRPVSAYLPGFSLRNTGEDDITLRGILTHYSALPSDFMKGYLSPLPDSKDGIDSLLPALKEETGISEGGDFYRYSNTGYELAAAVVSQVSGMPYSRYAEEKILTPLNMKSSGFQSSRQLSGSMAKGYTGDGETPFLPMRGNGVGDLITSTDDLIRFGRVFASGNGTILSDQGRTMMLAKQNGSNRYDFDLYRGLGWYRMEIRGYPGHFAWYHEGGTQPYSSILVVIPEFELCYSLLANEDEHSFSALSDGILRVLMREMTGKGPVSPYQGMKKSPVLNGSFYGTYATEMGGMTISGTGTGPVLEMMGMKLHIKRERGGYYGLQYRIFNLIPLPVADLKSIKIRFQDEDFTRFAIYTLGQYRGLGTLIEKKPISPEWRSRLGEYEITNSDDQNFLTSFDLSLDEGSGLPLMNVSVATINGVLSFPVDLSAPDSAVIEGRGRHLGDTIPLIRTGGEDLLYYSGYYLKKK